jgi:hypothetical protein
MQCIGSKSPQEIQPMNPIALGLVAPTTFNTDNSVSDQMRFQQQQHQQLLLLDEQRQLRQQHQAQVLCFQQNPLQGMLQQAANISKDTQEMNLMGNAQSNMGLNTQPTPSVGEVLSNTANEQNEAGGGGMLPFFSSQQQHLQMSAFQMMMLSRASSNAPNTSISNATNQFDLLRAQEPAAPPSSRPSSSMLFQQQDSGGGDVLGGGGDIIHQQQQYQQLHGGWDNVHKDANV